MNEMICEIKTCDLLEQDMLLRSNKYHHTYLCSINIYIKLCSEEILKQLINDSKQFNTFFPER